MPVRVLVTTTASTIAVLGLASYILLQTATGGIVDAKRQAAINEAVGVHAFMQQQLRGPETRGVAVSEALDRLADQAGAQTTQYMMVIHAPTSTLVSSGVLAESVPDELVETVGSQEGLFIAPTSVLWTDPEQADEPGLAIGTTLITTGGDRVPVFYVFPMTSELQVLRVMQSAVIATFLVLAVAIGLIVYLVTWQVVSPIRRASDTALRLASGQLDERMAVKGSDELASLAESMNQMAEELQARIRQLESLSAVQRRFVSDVSHELRTPLTTIKMAADMLYESREDFDPSALRTVELMWLEIERFDVLLADLLEISRFDAGAAVLTLDDYDLGAIVADEIHSYQPLAERQGTDIRLHLQTEEATAEIDARRIRRVLRNLLSNAIDHGQGKPVDVTVAADDDTVAVTVRDHGVGFEAEQSAQVFDRFWRADPARTRIVGGSGLGLAISLEDAKLHRGWLSAWGRPGRGAQFRLTLPRDQHTRVLASPLPVMPVDDEGNKR
ncbi:MAG: HAMP domain-containing histidine kinase [Propionibacterium sp.]|nr:HAMP domain-containing histidine kinase [Propionibacterium sp.]